MEAQARPCQYTYVAMINNRSPTGRTYAVEPDLYDDGVRKDIIIFTIIIIKVSGIVSAKYIKGELNDISL